MLATGGQMGQVTVSFALPCTAYIDNAMLVVGSQPADYVPLHPADDLARCLRYYQRWGAPASISVDQPLAQGQCASAGSGYCLIQYAGVQGGSPTATFSAPADWGVWQAGSGRIGVSTIGGYSAMNMTNNNRSSLLVSFSGATGLVAGNATTLTAGSGSASFAAEWNP